MLTKEQARRLRALAHDMKPLVQIGKLGMSEQLVKAVDTALADHELIKVKFMDFKEERDEISEQIAEATGSDLVGIIGNIAIFFRTSPDEKKRRIVLR